MSLDKNDLKALIGILQKLVQENDGDANDTTKTTKAKTKKSTRSPKARGRYAQQQHTNLFVDMPEARMHKDDTLIDKKLNKFPPTPRNRHATLVDVVCRVCGRKETISSKILPDTPDRYKCNNCSTSGG